MQNPQNFILKSITKHKKIHLYYFEQEKTVVIKGSSAAVSLCVDLFLFHFCYTMQFTGATCLDYSEIAQY